MQCHFIEVTQDALGGFNWGKFMLARFTAEQWTARSALPAAQGQLLLAGRGMWHDDVLVLDLETGEGAIFQPRHGLAGADLTRHQILVCPLFEPFLEWLYGYRPARPEAWWSELPDLVELPAAPGGLYGYRRPGPAGA